jgi:hypothetical protein
LIKYFKVLNLIIHQPVIDLIFSLISANLIKNENLSPKFKYGNLYSEITWYFCSFLQQIKLKCKEQLKVKNEAFIQLSPVICRRFNYTNFSYNLGKRLNLGPMPIVVCLIEEVLTMAREVADFTNILRAHLLPIFLCKKIETQTESR